MSITTNDSKSAGQILLAQHYLLYYGTESEEVESPSEESSLLSDTGPTLE